MLFLLRGESNFVSYSPCPPLKCCHVSSTYLRRAVNFYQTTALYVGWPNDTQADEVWVQYNALDAMTTDSSDEIYWRESRCHVLAMTDTTPRQHDLVTCTRCSNRKTPSL